MEESGLINYTRFLERYRVQVRASEKIGRSIYRTVDKTIWDLLERR